MVLEYIQQYLKHEVTNAPVELCAVVVLLRAQAEKILRHARHDVAVDLHVDVALGRLKLAVALHFFLFHGIKD